MNWLCLVCNTVNKPSELFKNNNTACLCKTNYKFCKICKQYNFYLTNASFDNYCYMNSIIDKYLPSYDTNIWIDCNDMGELRAITSFTITKERILEHIKVRLYYNRCSRWSSWHRNISNKKYIHLIQNKFENINNSKYLPSVCIRHITAYLQIQ